MLTEQEACGESSFITLTYEAEPLVYRPEEGVWIPTLVKSHVTSWLRSVRRKATHYGLPARYFLAGEYGEKKLRPHYHAILFGIGPTWRSIFERSWEHGFQSWYPANARCMAYVAKYCLKHGKDPELDLIADPETRVSEPPFRKTSRGPAIGHALAPKIADAVCRPGRPQDLLRAEKWISGSQKIGKDSYPIDRTIRDYVDSELATRYNVDDETRDRLLRRQLYEPTEIQIQNAKAAHVRAQQAGAARSKL